MIDYNPFFLLQIKRELYQFLQPCDHLVDQVKAALPEGCLAYVNAGFLEQFHRGY